MNIKVAKFGGTSLSDAKHFSLVRNIILSSKDRRYIVPSAPGKRNQEEISWNIEDKFCPIHHLSKELSLARNMVFSKFLQF